jgi:hypothetical protein
MRRHFCRAGAPSRLDRFVPGLLSLVAVNMAALVKPLAHWTTRVIIVERSKVPDIPVIVAVYVPRGVPGTGEEPPPASLPPAPQASWKQPTANVEASVNLATSFCPFHSWHANRRPATSSAAKPIQGMYSCRVASGAKLGTYRVELACVVMVSEEVTRLVPGVTVAGENTQEVRAGKPEHESTMEF